MKSTGEALGGDVSLEKALYKALVASGVRIPQYGNVLMTIADEDKEEALQLAKRFYDIGYGIYATRGTARLFKQNGLFVHAVDKISEAKEDDTSVLDIIRQGKVSFVINTMNSSDRTTNLDGFLIRRVSAENNISCMTSLDTASALLGVLESQSFSMVSMNEKG
jgi:carbamoyl-phosphate synthase large subunit